MCVHGWESWEPQENLQSDQIGSCTINEVHKAEEVKLRTVVSHWTERMQAPLGSQMEREESSHSESVY